MFTTLPFLGALILCLCFGFARYFVRLRRECDDWMASRLVVLCKRASTSDLNELVHPFSRPLSSLWLWL